MQRWVLHAMTTHITFLRRAASTAAITATSFSVAISASAQTSAADAAYDRAAKAYASFSSIDAQFEQKTTNPILGKSVTSRGRFVQQKPNLVSITFTDPAGDRIVGDGKYLWVFLPSSTPNQVMKLPAKSDAAVIVNLLGRLLDAPRKSFTISGGEAVTVDGVATRKVLLVSKDADNAPFQRATLWIDDKDSRPVRVQVIDPQGIDRTFNMTSWAVNTAPAKDVFRFSPPKGVKVVSKIPA